MPEALGFGVAAVICEIGVVFGAVIPGEFEEAGKSGCVSGGGSGGVCGIGGVGRGVVVAQEVEIEVVGGVGGGAEEGHSYLFKK